MNDQAMRPLNEQGIYPAQFRAAGFEECGVSGSGLGFGVWGLWFMVYGLWCMVYGL